MLYSSISRTFKHFRRFFKFLQVIFILFQKQCELSSGRKLESWKWPKTLFLRRNLLFFFRSQAYHITFSSFGSVILESLRWKFRPIWEIFKKIKQYEANNRFKIDLCWNSLWLFLQNNSGWANTLVGPYRLKFLSQ